MNHTTTHNCKLTLSPLLHLDSTLTAEEICTIPEIAGGSALHERPRCLAVHTINASVIGGFKVEVNEV